MVEPAGGARLLIEAEAVLLGRAGREELDGDVALELQIARPENAAHPAAAQLLLDPVPAGQDPARRGSALLVWRPLVERRPVALHSVSLKPSAPSRQAQPSRCALSRPCLCSKR